MDSLELGCQAKDIVTGFNGIVMARCEYFTGCITYEVMKRKRDKDLKSKSIWFDEKRLKRTGNGLIEKRRAKRTGGPPQSIPQRFED